ncbi:response regulator [Pedobacter westerhofensis]|nr:response regulator transcription factor [Pedobacter westerhofensis]
MSQYKYKMAIVDDHPIVIEGLKNLLAAQPDLEITGSFTTGTEFLVFLKDHVVDVVLLDITLPDISGIELCKEIRMMAPQTFVLALSNHNERSMIFQMLHNGASGYLLKNASANELINSIHEALEGKVTFSNSIREIMSMPHLTEFREKPAITKRELEILKLIAQGETTAGMAESLFLSKLTIETHRRNLLQKFAVKNVAQLISIATQQGIVP